MRTRAASSRPSYRLLHERLARRRVQRRPVFASAAVSLRATVRDARGAPGREIEAERLAQLEREPQILLGEIDGEAGGELAAQHLRRIRRAEMALTRDGSEHHRARQLG